MEMLDGEASSFLPPFSLFHPRNLPSLPPLATGCVTSKRVKYSGFWAIFAALPQPQTQLFTG